MNWVSLAAAKETFRQDRYRLMQSHSRRDGHQPSIFQPLNNCDAQARSRKRRIIVRQLLKLSIFFPIVLWACSAFGEITSGVIDIPTRAGVTQRVLIVAPPAYKAAVVLFAGGHGGLQITPDGEIGWGKNNFLVRTRQLFADQGLLTLVIDAPSDRQTEPFLDDFRQTEMHVADIKAIIAWIRGKTKVPVWLVGTSRGTESVAYIATEISTPEGPDGIVLTSSVLFDNTMTSVPSLPLEAITIPVLVVHHELDGCKFCPYWHISSLMEKLNHAKRKELLSFTGGQSIGNPCQAMAYHGYNGIENSVVMQISAWILKE
jgi:pimeloyl-ACP methyl ester carboxylesterase